MNAYEHMCAGTQVHTQTHVLLCAHTRAHAYANEQTHTACIHTHAHTCQPRCAQTGPLLVLSVQSAGPPVASGSFPSAWQTSPLGTANHPHLSLSRFLNKGAAALQEVLLEAL